MPMSATLLAVSTSVHSCASAQADSPFHGNEPALAFIHFIIDSAYVGMVQSKGGPSLTVEPLQGSAIARDLLGKEFHKATVLSSFVSSARSTSPFHRRPVSL